MAGAMGRHRAAAAATVAMAAWLASARAQDTPPAQSVETPMATVVVRAPALTVENRIDRKVYNLATDPQSTFGALSDVLNVIPSVNVDPDGTVSLRGDSKVLILIDGKPSAQFSGATAGDALQAIPAKDIERIEVLTTPPAQFKADGAAGVINIILRHKRDDGTSGAAQAAVGNQGRWSVAGDYGIRSGAWTTSFTGSTRDDYRERHADSIVSTATTLKQTLNAEQMDRKARAASVSTEFALSENRTLRGAVTLSERGGPRHYTQLETTMAGANLTRSSRRLSAGNDPQDLDDQRLSYTHKLARPGEQFDLSLHRSRSTQEEYYYYTDDSFIPVASTAYRDLNFTEDNRNLEADADYTLPLSNAHKVKLGYSFSQENYRYTSTGNNFDATGKVPTPNPFIRDDFRVRQLINAAYASWQWSGDDWGVLGGVRVEDARLRLNQANDGRVDRQAYLRWYPSLHLTRSLSETAVLSFGASRRVSRPDPDELNPHVDYEYTPDLSSGNPALKPQDTRSFEVGYDNAKRGLTYGVTAYLRQIRDRDATVTEYFADGTSLTTRVNLGKSRNFGTELNIGAKLFDRLSINVSADAFHNEIDTTPLGIPGTKSNLGVNGKLKLDYQPRAADSAQLSISRTDSRLTPQGNLSAVSIVNLGYRHKMGTRFATVITVSDVFDGQRTRRISRTSSFAQDYQRATQGRLIYVGLTYSFGSAKKSDGFEYQQ